MDKIFAARNLFFAKAFLLPQMCVGQNINSWNQNFNYLFLFRGRTPEYYSKAIGPFLASLVAKVRNTFQYGSEGPETKV